MTLPIECYQLAEPPNTQPCLACGGCYEPNYRPMVAFDVSADKIDDVVRGKIATVGRQAGATVVRGSNPEKVRVDPPADVTVRQEFDENGGATTTIMHPQLCGGCVKAAARLLDLGDLTPLQAELAEKEKLIATLEQALERTNRENRENERTIRDQAVQLRAFERGDAARGGKRKAA